MPEGLNRASVVLPLPATDQNVSRDDIPEPFQGRPETIILDSILRRGKAFVE